MNKNQTLLIEQCENQLNELKKSPCFIMSLGAKELFHSNFLAFLLETEHESLVNVQKELKKCFGLDKNKKVFVWREKNNLDLVLIQADIENEKNYLGCNPKLVIIENKLKSTPTEKQLTDYDEKIKKGISFTFDDPVCWEGFGRIDLVKICKNHNKLSLMVKKEHLTNRQQYKTKKDVEITKYIISIQNFKNNVGWNSVQWESINTLIDNGLIDNALRAETNNDNQFITKLVEDYSKTIKNLITVANNTTDFCNEYAKNNITFKDFRNQITSSQFKSLRIHDLVGKIAFSQLVKLLLKEHLSQVKTPNNETFNSYPFYSNQLPGFGFEWLITKKQEGAEIRFSIGVQVQGDHYRHFIEAYPESLDSKLNRFGQQNKMKDWFYPHINPESEFPNFFGQNNACNDFLKFNTNKFIYTKTENNDFTFVQLKELIEKSMSHALKFINDPDLNIELFMKNSYKK